MHLSCGFKLYLAIINCFIKALVRDRYEKTSQPIYMYLKCLYLSVLLVQPFIVFCITLLNQVICLHILQNWNCSKCC